MENKNRNIVIGVVGVVVIFGTVALFYNQYKKNNPPPAPPRNTNPDDTTKNTVTCGGGSNANVGGSKVSVWRMLFSPFYTYNVLTGNNNK